VQTTGSSGRGGIDAVNRWISIVLATLVGMLGTFGFLLRRAHHRRRFHVSR
jgi:hypothetical protein